MDIIKRPATDDEYKMILDDFKAIDIKNGIPQIERNRLDFVAEDDGKIIGFVSGLTTGSWFCLTDLWVSEHFRRKGLATILLRKMEGYVLEKGMTKIYTQTTGQDNQTFYKAQGYTVFGMIENFYGIPNINVIHLRKDLINL